VLSVGRLAKEKRQEVLLRAVAQSKFRDNIELNIVGAGPMEAELTKLAAELGLRARICSVSDDALLDLYASASLFVHTGEIELEGMSVVEAMGAGNTVIVSDSKDSATAGLVNGPRSLFRNGDSLDLAAKIDYWLAHPDEKLQECRSNREWARHRSHKGSVALMASVYDEFLALDSLMDGNTQLE
jgi:glycosyltransferase involved in cell wall biosynthesis